MNDETSPRDVAARPIKTLVSDGRLLDIARVLSRTDTKTMLAAVGAALEARGEGELSSAVMDVYMMARANAAVQRPRDRSEP